MNPIAARVVNPGNKPGISVGKSDTITRFCKRGTYKSATYFPCAEMECFHGAKIGKIDQKEP